jgi:hypothetical protein
MAVQPPAAHGREPLSGLVERVTYHNPDNGFCALRVKLRGRRDLVTVIGHAPTVSVGEYVQASGIWELHREHGQQFRAAFMKATAPDTVEGIEKYPGAGMFKGIGPIYARKLVRAFPLRSMLSARWPNQKLMTAANSAWVLGSQMRGRSAARSTPRRQPSRRTADDGLRLIDPIIPCSARRAAARRALRKPTERARGQPGTRTGNRKGHPRP